MIRQTLMCALIPFMLGPVAALAAAPAAAGAFEFALQPGKVHEECLRLEAGKSRTFEWTADAPVDFNIHYHRGDDVSYPVKRDAARGDRGTFTAKTGEDYCWMWSAKGAAKVRGWIKSAD